MKQFIVYIDLRRAFDSISRPKLLRIMAEANLPYPLLVACRDLLTDTSGIINGTTVATNIGSP